MNFIRQTRIYFLLLSCLGGTQVIAQNSSSETSVAEAVTNTESSTRSTVIWEQVRSFSIYFVEGGPPGYVTLKVTYRSDRNMYEIKFVGTEDSFAISSPPSLGVFRSVFTDTFHKSYTGHASKTPSEQTIQSIFYWLYSLRSDPEDDDVNSGDLNLKRWAMVFDADTDVPPSTAAERQELLSKVENQAAPYYTARTSAQKRLNAALDHFSKMKVDSPARHLRPEEVANLNRVFNAIETPLYENNAASFVADIRNIFPVTTQSVIEKALNDVRQAAYDYDRFSDSISGLERTMADNNIYPITKISIQFQRGFFERVQVWVKKRSELGGEEIFENSISMGFSSVKNFRILDKQKLFIRRGGFNEYIYLTDAIGNYDNLLELYRRDYSPADTALNKINPFQQPVVTLKKERLIHLFDSRIYTDLVGFDDESPNGLVQVEVSRRFNFNNNRKQNGSMRSAIGWFNYIYMYGSLNKIEDKLKRLPLENVYQVENNTVTSPNYVTNLSLRQYENFSIGTEVNFFAYDWPDSKIMFHIDLGMRYGHIPIVDSTLRLTDGSLQKQPGVFTNLEANTATFYPKFSLELLAERRVGFVLSYQCNHTRLFTNDFKQVASLTKSDLSTYPVESRARSSHMAELCLRIETSRTENGRIFMRSRFFWQQGDVNTFFPQVQLGYAYNLLFRK